MKGLEAALGKAMQGTIVKMVESSGMNDVLLNVTTQIRARFDAIEQKCDLILTAQQAIAKRLDEMEAREHERNAVG